MELLVFIGVPLVLFFIMLVVKSAKNDMAWLEQWGGRRFRRVYAAVGIALLIFSSMSWRLAYHNDVIVPVGIIAFVAGIILIFASIWNTWKGE